jgi:hypothetical protein
VSQKRPSKDTTSARSQTTLQGTRCDHARQLRKHRQPQRPSLHLQPPLPHHERTQTPSDQTLPHHRRHSRMRLCQHELYHPRQCPSERDPLPWTLLLRLALGCISPDNQGIRATQAFLQQHAKVLVQTDVRHHRSRQQHLHHGQRDPVLEAAHLQAVCQGLALFTRFVG